MMMQNRRAFVLLETIVVITVLCVILVVLYASYSKVLIDVNKRAIYDNSEYIYKTAVIRDYLEEELLTSKNQNISNYMGSNFLKVYCSDNMIGEKKCNADEFLNFIGAQSIYFTKWDTSSLSTADFRTLEATTQSYIKTLDTVSADGVFRIIVMYKDENIYNDESERFVLDADDIEEDYQYATLRFGNRG